MVNSMVMKIKFNLKYPLKVPRHIIEVDQDIAHYMSMLPLEIWEGVKEFLR